MSETYSYADLTLNDALKAFRREHGLEAKYATMTETAQDHFARHDTVHVLFGLDTSIRQEAQADGWTLFGTDIKMREISEFMALPEEKELISEIGLGPIVKGYLSAFIDYPKIVWRARRLRKKWPWSGNTQFRDWTVRDIRREFGIDRVLKVYFGLYKKPHINNEGHNPNDNK